MHVTEVVVKAIEKAQEVLGAHVRHVVAGAGIDVSDVEQVVTSAFGSELLVYQCQGHLIRRMLSEITSNNQECLLSQLKEVLQLVAEKPDIHLNLATAGLPPPPQPTAFETDLRETLEYFTTNWGRLADVMTQTDNPDMESMDVLNDVNARQILYDILAALTSIERALARLEKDNATLGDAVEVWLDIMEEAKQIESQHVRDVLEQEAVQVLKQVRMLSVNLLDPRYFGVRLQPPEMRKIMEHSQLAHPEITTDMMKFIARTSPYDFNNINSDNPTVWWTAGRRLGFNEELCDVAMKLVTAAPTAGNANTSLNLSDVTTQALSHLDSDRAERYIFCYTVFHNK